MNNPTFQKYRSLTVSGVKAVLSAQMQDHTALSRLDEPNREVSFEELTFDSLLRMEFCIWLQVEADIEIEESVLVANPTIDSLARYLAENS